MAFNPLQQLKSLVQLPGAKLKARRAADQAEAVKSRLAAVQPAGVPSPVGRQAQVATAAPVVGPAQSAQPEPVPAPDLGPVVAPEAEAEAKPDDSDLRSAEEAIKAAQRKRLEAEVVSPEEQEAEKTLQNVLTSKELGVQAVREKPIALEFITGQQRAVEARAATQAAPLQARVAQLQGRRQASIGSAAAGVEEAKGLRDIAKDRFDRAKGKDKSQTDRDREVKTEVVKRASPKLIESRGQDGYVDPGVYLDLRQQYSEAIGDPKGFDDIFKPMLSPQERARLFSEKSVPSASNRVDDSDSLDSLLSSYLSS